MNSRSIRGELEGIAHSDPFALAAETVVARWRDVGVGDAAIEPVLQFMEDNPTLDFGVPGPLVHFLESTTEARYVPALLDSVDRLPTFQTTWMLNRLLNASPEAGLKRQLIDAMKRARAHPRVDAETRAQVDRFLARLA